MNTQINMGKTRLIFGQGAVKAVPDEVKRYGVKHPFIITDESLLKLGVLDGLFEALKEQDIPWCIYDGVKPDPISGFVDAAAVRLKEERCDGVIGIGGGSVMDTAKCVAAMVTNEGLLLDYDHANAFYKEFEKESLPLIQIPTTAGTGSELSPYAVITNEKEGRKATIGSPMLYCRSAVVDPCLTLGLPEGVTASTGADALTHCIEAYTTIKSMQIPNLMIDALAQQGVKCLLEALPKICKERENTQLREMIMWGSTIGGFVLQYGSGAAHGLGNVLGGVLHVPHGNAVGMLLPHVMRFNLDVCGVRYAELGKAIGLTGENNRALSEKFVETVEETMEALHLPPLSKWLNEKERIEQLSELALKDKCTRINGKEVTKEDARAIYEKAYE